jgi:hypothetical protein
MEQVKVHLQFAGSDSLYTDDYFGDVSGLTDFTRDLVDRVTSKAWSIAGQPRALVLKSPELSFFVSEAVDVLGATARFVFSVREPKDTIASMIRVGERQRAAGVQAMLAQAGRNIDRLCMVYNQAYVPILKYLQSPGSRLRERVLFVKYEDLVSKPEETRSRICAFCEISPGELPSGGNWRAAKSAARFAEHPKWRTYMTDLSRQSVSGSSVGNYKKVLNAADCARIDMICRPVREHFGYL